MTSKHFIQFDSTTKQYHCQGEWTLEHIAVIKKELEKITWPTTDNIILTGNAVTQLDSAGAWIINQLLKTQKIKINIQNFSAQHQALFSIIKKQTTSELPPKTKTFNWLSRIGYFFYQQVKEALTYSNFVGQLSMESLRVIAKPSRLRFRAIASVIEKTGFQALPIIALLSFMIGVVISYQMGNQLRTYGANVFIVDLLGLSILREFGPLLTAIMVAGRTGSSFTAQIGIMKLNQEIDALNTMGVTPTELLLLPRLIGLVIALPLLTIWADIFGILGGMVMAKSMLGVGWYDFILRFEHQIPLRALIIGLGKAPVFALIIASIGCFEGMRVEKSAESVGTRTTRSVVLAIFFIIIIDAIFSILFSKFQL